MKLNKIVFYIGKRTKQVGEQTVYAVLLMYHAYKREETPFWARNIIMASVAYFLSPFDAIPDLTPFLGFTDDLSVMMFGLVSIACFINKDVRGKARESLGKVFKEYDEALLLEVDEKL
jgi:uncharacterized membrane protein YkvA (DUF1232 family)